MYPDDNIQTPVPSSIDADTRVHSHPLALADYDREAVTWTDMDAPQPTPEQVSEPPVTEVGIDPEDYTPDRDVDDVLREAADIDLLWKLRAITMDTTLTRDALTDEHIIGATAGVIGQPTLGAGYISCIADKSLRSRIVVEVAALIDGELDTYGWDALFDAKNGPALSADEAADLRASLDGEVEEWAKGLFADADALRVESERLARESGVQPGGEWQAWSRAGDVLREVIGGPDWGAQARHAEQLREALADDDDETEDDVDMSKPEDQAPAAAARPLVPEGQPTPRDTPPWTPLPMPAAATGTTEAEEVSSVTENVVAGPWQGAQVPAGAPVRAGMAPAGDLLARARARMESWRTLWTKPDAHPDDEPYTAGTVGELPADEHAAVLTGLGVCIPRKAWRAMSPEQREIQRAKVYGLEEREFAPHNEEVYPLGYPSDPALIRSICDYSDRTRAVFHAARGVRSAHPVVTILQSLIRTGQAAPTDLGPYPGVPLSTYVSVIGKSGAGKGQSTTTRTLPWGAAVQDIRWAGAGWTVPDIDAESGELGSGQVMVDRFVEEYVDDATGEKDFRMKPHPSARIEMDEIATTLAVASGGSSTIVPTMTSAWSNKAIGADTRQHGVGRRTSGDYSVFAIGGIQVHKGREFMDTAGVGLAQRFIHTLPTDPYRHMLTPCIADPRTRFAYPAPPSVVVPATGLILCDEIEEALNANEVRAAIDEEQEDDEEAHAALARIRLACLVALWHGRFEVTNADWRWAGAVMEFSRRSWAFLKAAVERQEKEASRQVGIGKGIELDAAKAVQGGAYQDRFDAVAKKVKAAGKSGVLISQLRNGMSKSKGQQQLITSQLGQIVSEMTSGPTAVAHLAGKRVIWGKGSAAKMS